VDKAQLHVPQFLLCLDDEADTLDRKIFLNLRGIQFFSFVTTLIICEKKIGTITTVFVSSFQLLVLQTRIRLELTGCQFCVLKGLERSTGLEGRRCPGLGIQGGRVPCGRSCSLGTL